MIYPVLTGIRMRLVASPVWHLIGGRFFLGQAEQDTSLPLIAVVVGPAQVERDSAARVMAVKANVRCNAASFREALSLAEAVGAAMDEQPLCAPGFRVLGTEVGDIEAAETEDDGTFVVDVPYTVRVQGTRHFQGV